MHTTTQKVITVIPNWNLKEDLTECVDSLQKNHWNNHEIVVVDNASTDGSVEYLRAHYPEIKIIQLEENIGFAGAVNAGIRYALDSGAEYIFALNNDTTVPPDAVSKLVSRMQSNERIGILTPKVVFYNRPDIIYSLGSRSYSFFPLPLEFGRRWKDSRKYQGLILYDYVSGCAIMIRAKVIQEIGLFDESFFMYYEDGDFCRRVRMANYLIGCDCDVVIKHKASLSSKKQGARTLVYRTRNKVWFHRRYHHGPMRLFTWVALWIMAIIYLLRYFIIGQTGLAHAYWEGFILGWRTEVPELKGVDL